MMTFNKKTFAALANEKGDMNLSIYLPAPKAGVAVNENHAQIKLKTLLKTVKTDLASAGWHASRMEAFLEPVLRLLDDVLFWKNLHGGLALFRSAGRFEVLNLPYPFKVKYYLGPDFYLIPMIGFLNRLQTFHLLNLSLNNVELYRCDTFHYEKVPLENITPSRLEEVVGYDYRERFLQFRTQSGGGGALFHGHGEWQADKKDEIVRFFRAIDQGILPMLRASKRPLIVACVEYLFPLYQQANQYEKLEKTFLPGNPEQKEMGALHQEAVDILEKHQQDALNEKVAQFHNLSNAGKSSYEFEEIVLAAASGKVETLFLNGVEDIYGQYSLESMMVERQAEKTPENISLLNSIALQTFLQKGQVFRLTRDQMPVKGTAVNAIFRY